MKDTVYRQAAIDAVNDVIAEYIPTLYGRYEALPLEMAIAIKRLPSAEPERRNGHWRRYEGMLICQNCGAEFYDDIMEYTGDDVPRFCLNCGADMRG